MKDRKPLRGLLLAQFLGAFNDNAFKLFVIVLGEQALRGAAEVEKQKATMFAFVVFTLPLALFSLPAGVLADRLSKRTLILGTKALEILLMAAGAVVFFANPGYGTAPLVVLGLMGLQSAFFSPAKYGILPELVPHAELSDANGKLEFWSFLAIIAGTALGPTLLGWSGAPGIAALVLLATAGAGFLAALRIPHLPPARTTGGFADTIGGSWRAIRADRALWLAILGAAWFWGIASLLGQNIFVYAQTRLGLTDEMTGLPVAVYGLGVGIGSYLAGKLSHDKVETGLIPLGATGLGVVVLLMGMIAPGAFGTFFLMALLGFASGCLIVPLDALLQWRAPADRRGGVIALGNVFVFGGMLVGSLAGGWMAQVGLDSRGIFIGAAVVTLAGTAWALWLLPEAFLRLLGFLWTHTFYRVTVNGRENVPETGGVLLTPNHVSFVDGFFVAAVLDRPVRFLVDEGQFNRPLFKHFLKAMGAIPISTEGGMRQILRALRDAGEYLDKGEVVCIFPEGQLTRTGQMQPFRRGVERIAKGRSAPIVPVHLDNVWGSIFSFAGGRFVSKIPKRIPYPITVSFGDPLPPDTPVAAIRQAVRELGENAWRDRTAQRPPLHHTALAMSRRGRRKLAVSDAIRPSVSRLALIAGAVAFARALREPWRGQPHVGILLPPSAGGAVINLAAAFAGKASVNLNYTAGAAGMGSAARQAGVTNVVTSRMFLEKAKLELPDGVTPLYLEDFTFSGGDKLRALLLALFGSARRIERACGAERPVTGDDLATIIFSSGSTGEPKGVMLTHANLDANVEAVAQVLRVQRDDRLLGILPLFHSFGFMTLWFGFNHGVPAVFWPNPLDGPAIGRLVAEHRVTILIGTPTFLQMYLRRCTPEQFGSLRLVLAGAEQLTERLANAFEETFGVRPLEGYGATECAPVIAVSVPSYRAPGFFQPGSRRGFVGPPLPGVAARIVDPDTGEPLPTDTPGMLLVRGPNVMRGYLGRDDLTAKALRDGWYVTGDIALVDDDGFIKITGRLSRFSKIGGEMVPHGTIEEALHDAYGGPDGVQVFAVTAVPDEKKGERLAVLHTIDEARVPEIIEKLGAAGLPNLFIPRKDSFVKVDAIPLLGTGKTDLRAVKRIASDAIG